MFVDGGGGVDAIEVYVMWVVVRVVIGVISVIVFIVYLNINFLLVRIVF